MISDQLRGDEALNDFNEYTYQCVAKNPTWVNLLFLLTIVRKYKIFLDQGRGLISLHE